MSNSIALFPGSPAVQPAVSPLRFPLIPFNKIQFQPTSRYLVKGLFPAQGLLVAWGPPKCGKSFWVSDIALHVALGWPYRGRKVRQGTVIYIALEGELGLGARVEAFRRDKLAEEQDGLPFFLLTTRLNLAADYVKLSAEIRAQLAETKPALIVIDTLNRSLAGSESSDEDMGAYVRGADAIKDAFECLVAIVHHCGIAGDRPRGHTSLTGACDVQISVRRDTADNIVCKIECAKDAPSGEEVVSRLKTVELEKDEDGDAITSCVVEAVEGGSSGEAPNKTAKLSDAHRNALDMLKRAIDEEGQIPPANKHIPPNYRAVKVETWRRYCDKGTVSDSEKSDSRLKAFKRAADRLQALNIVGTCDGWCWIMAR